MKWHEAMMTSGPAGYQDEALADNAAMCVDLLRSLASRWQFRIQAGRLGQHPVAESERLVRSLEAAARLIEDSAGVPAPPGAPDSPPAAVAQSAERFRLLVDGIMDYAIFFLDPDGRIASWNAGAERIKGYRAEEVLGSHFSRFFTPEDAAAGKPARALEIASREGRYVEEGWRVRNHGERFWASVTLTALRDSQGRLLGFAKVTRDVTEIRGAQEALRLSEERLRLMIEAVCDYAIFMLDPDGRVISWNTGAERLKGYRPSEIIGQHFSIFYTGEDRQRAHPDAELERALADGRYEEEGWRIRKDGTRFWANVVITPVFDLDRKHLGFTKVTRDFTERRAAAAHVRQSEERFRLLVESVRDYAIFMLDPDGRITSWNAGAERIKGYTAGDVIGKHFSIFYTDEDRQRCHPAHELREAVATGSYSEAGWRIRKDGTRFWANVVITALMDEHGRHVGFAKVTRDMTEQRLAEDALLALNEDLERRIELRTAELSAANKELETFSYTVSHDLRAPLRALDGFSRLLLEEASDKLSAEQQGYLGRIRAAAQRMAQLTEALLMLSRLTRTPIHRQPADLSSLAEGIVAELRQGEPEREVEVAIAPGLAAMADPGLLRIALENLLRNAWKFTRKQPHARIEVGASGVASVIASVNASGGADGEQVFFVRDNGVGFDPAHMSRLFVPFQRLHRARDFEGTGIGLATVHRIVERHRGRVWAEATPGHGATFHFTLGRPDAPRTLAGVEDGPEDGPKPARAGAARVREVPS